MMMLSIAFRVAVETYNRKSKQNGSIVLDYHHCGKIPERKCTFDGKRLL